MGTLVPSVRNQPNNIGLLNSCVSFKILNRHSTWIHQTFCLLLSCDIDFRKTVLFMQFSSNYVILITLINPLKTIICVAKSVTHFCRFHTPSAVPDRRERKETSKYGWKSRGTLPLIFPFLAFRGHNSGQMG